MIQARHQHRLALESRHAVWVLRELLGQRLNDYIAAKLCIGGGRGRDSALSLPPSLASPGELHPEALTEPCVTVSCHAARAIH
jgi:hypothetical protein